MFLNVAFAPNDQITLVKKKPANAQLFVELILSMVPITPLRLFWRFVHQMEKVGHCSATDGSGRWAGPRLGWAEACGAAGEPVPLRRPPALDRGPGDPLEPRGRRADRPLQPRDPVPHDTRRPPAPRPAAILPMERWLFFKASCRIPKKRWPMARL